MLEFDPFSYQTQEDPYPAYRALRDQAPAYRNPRHGFWVLSRHADVLEGFRNAESFSSAQGVAIESGFEDQAVAIYSILAMDPPRHDQVRALVSRGFTPRRVAALEPWIRRLARRCLDRVADAGRFDFIQDFAARIPMDVISEMLGVPEPDRDQLRRLSDTIVHREEGSTEIPAASMQASVDLRGYFVDWVADARKRDGDDLAGTILRAEIDGERLSEDELVGFFFLLVVAGNETTTKLLGNAVYHLWRNPEQRDKVRRDPARIVDWVEETLRYDNSTQAMARTVARTTRLHGETLRPGERALLLIGSANRDERVFERPDLFDLDRDTSALLSFGKGTHFCLGASLARLEARVCLEELQRRVPDFEVDASGLVRVHSTNVRGFAALPLETA